MSIYRHIPQNIQDYHDSPSINQSALKSILAIGVQAYTAEGQKEIHEDEIYYEEKEHFLIGKAVDVLITEGRNMFDSAYFYSRLQKKPAEKPMAIVKKVFESLDVTQRSNALGHHRWELYEAMNTITDAEGKVGYYMNFKVPSDKTKNGEPDKRQWVEDKRHELLLKDGTCQAYWVELMEADGKKILTEEQRILVETIVDNFLGHKFTKELFNPESYSEGKDDIIYQMPLYWEELVGFVRNGKMEYIKVQCKCLIDCIRVNHAHKSIVPFDIKTTRLPISRFNKQIEWRRYDIQGAFYSRGVSKCIGVIEDLIGRKLDGYSITNFAFIAESTKYPGTPMIFPMNSALMKVGEEGDEERGGYMDALREYALYQSHDFNPTELFESVNGVVWVGEDFELQQVLFNS